MGTVICKKRIKLVDMIPKEKKYDYLRPNGEIILKLDEDFNIPTFEIRSKKKNFMFLLLG